MSPDPERSLTKPCLRQCITCRRQFPRSELLRVTCTQQGKFSVDNRPPLEGRSAYVCRNQSCLSNALKGRKFHRTLKRALPDAIVDTLNDQLKGFPPQ